MAESQTDDYLDGFKHGQLSMLFTGEPGAGAWPMTRELLAEYQIIAASRARGEVLDAIQADAVLSVLLPGDMLNRITNIIYDLTRQALKARNEDA
jgi:hypothetical protein